jgi:HAD superfamily hydrolase (TIGR01484 family)
MIMLACDLDNTLIYGKPAHLDDYVAAESIAGKAVTYISKKALTLLESLDQRVAFVPVTARSIEEYRRISFFNRHIPRYAVTSFGGIILKDGKIDAEWQGRCKTITAPVIDEIESMCCSLQKDARVSRSRIVDGIYLFIKAKAAENIVAEITSADTLDLFTILRCKEKIYVIPKGIDKGIAAERVQVSLGAKQLVAAGDSEADIPFLTIADYALVPQEDLVLQLAGPCVAVNPKDSDFAAFILESVVQMLAND